MISRFARAEYQVETSHLSPGDRKALPELIAASRILDRLFLQQMWRANPELYRKLQRDHSPLGRARLHYFEISKMPWSELEGGLAFLPDVPAKRPPGSNFYPEDMTRQEFESWVQSLPPAEKELAQGFFTVIRRGGNRKLTLVPYNREYAGDLGAMAGHLRNAAAATDNASLRKFLSLRADALLSNDYYASDLAWMDLDAPIDVTFGPYETYNDQTFGYKAAFEAYIHIRDDRETEKVKFFASHLQEVENNLPIDARFRNPKLGGMSPIRVVNQVFGAGDGNHGVQTAAYNLPNDERVVRQKGSKQVLMRNVQLAKFEKTLVPISRRVLPASDLGDLEFDAFFTHILAHELSHGIGPHVIRRPGAETTPRKELKQLYSAIEEAKADVTGLFLLQHLMERGLVPAGAERERKLYTTFLASTFRTLRFGIHEAHGKGMSIQFRFYLEHGAVVQASDGRFSVNLAKMKEAVRELAHRLLTIEAEGNYEAANRLLEQAKVLPEGMQRALDGLKDLPTDIEPVFVTAPQLTQLQK
ncbi:MAG: hypothetical protein NTY38_01380 [Acidobacteria bacterium]|nr:hypothetical protein [Acidobacteriota bacterium]